MKQNLRHCHLMHRERIGPTKIGLTSVRKKIKSNKSVLSLLRRLSTWRYTRICCWAPAHAARRPQLSTDICCICRRSTANPPAAVDAVHWWDRLTDNEWWTSRESVSINQRSRSQLVIRQYNHPVLCLRCFCVDVQGCAGERQRYIGLMLCVNICSNAVLPGKGSNEIRV